MAEKPGAPAAGEGQPGAAPQGTTPPDPKTPVQGQAQAGGEAGTSPAATPSGPKENEFFDPNNVPTELQEPYNQMRTAFTKKMQEIAKNREKITAYEAFMQNPIPEMQRLAGQYGFQLSPAGQQAGNGEKKPFEPQSWDDVFAEWEKRMSGKLDERMRPIMTNVQKLATTNIEQQLSSIDGNWRFYEEEMKENFRKHPTLVNDAALLYRMSVPEEVLTSRAVQQALKKFEDKAKSAAIQGNQGVPRSAPQAPTVTDFNGAVNAAKEQLRQEGRYK